MEDNVPDSTSLTENEKNPDSTSLTKNEKNPEKSINPPDQDEKNPADEGGVFECAICHWSESYHGHGSNISFARAIVFNEDAYVMRDPFTPWAHNAFVFLGAPCSMCQKLICVNCSVFYAKRFCSGCATENLQHFPVEVQKKIQQLTTIK